MALIVYVLLYAIIMVGLNPKSLTVVSVGLLYVITVASQTERKDMVKFYVKCTSLLTPNNIWIYLAS